MTEKDDGKLGGLDTIQHASPTPYSLLSFLLTDWLLGRLACFSIVYFLAAT
jgi:hypothetical protein